MDARAMPSLMVVSRWPLVCATQSDAANDRWIFVIAN
jgi:hypothetical protein